MKERLLLRIHRRTGRQLCGGTNAKSAFCSTLRVARPSIFGWPWTDRRIGANLLNLPPLSALVLHFVIHGPSGKCALPQAIAILKRMEIIDVRGDSDGQSRRAMAVVEGVVVMAIADCGTVSHG
jgi:hypothetical protein